MPDAQDAGITESGGGSHAACAPMRGIGWRLASCLRYNFPNLGGRDCRRPPRSRRIFLDTFPPCLQVAPAPPSCLLGCNGEFLSDLLILLALSSQQDNPSSFHL